MVCEECFKKYRENDNEEVKCNRCLGVDELGMEGLKYNETILMLSNIDNFETNVIGRIGIIRNNGCKVVDFGENEYICIDEKIDLFVRVKDANVKYDDRGTIMSFEDKNRDIKIKFEYKKDSFDISNVIVYKGNESKEFTIENYNELPIMYVIGKDWNNLKNVGGRWVLKGFND